MSENGVYCCRPQMTRITKENSEMRKHIFVFALLIVCAVAVRSAGTFSDSPEVGSLAPDFKLTTTEGKLAGLGDFKGKWLVLYFYPKDFTSGCTLEAHNFQRDIEQYGKLNAVVLGVSVDTAES